MQRKAKAVADALDVEAAKQQKLADRVAGKRRNRAARNGPRAAKHQVPIFLVMASLAADVEGDPAGGDGKKVAVIRGHYGPVDEKGRILTGGWTDFYTAMALSVHERLHGPRWWRIGKGSVGASKTHFALLNQHWKQFSNLSLSTLQNWVVEWRVDAEHKSLAKREADRLAAASRAVVAAAGPKLGDNSAPLQAEDQTVADARLPVEPTRGRPRVLPHHVFATVQQLIRDKVNNNTGVRAVCVTLCNLLSPSMHVVRRIASGCLSWST